jgi:crotonobetainyl-CoA:carnitine CoA-transferase CaiB-like acyl-CoA transferase
MATTSSPQLLPGVRVLDLTDDKGLLAGKLLADMGADVILVEPPGGNPARHLGPFYKDQPGAETSLSWFAYNTNKRSMVLDLQQSDGQALFRRLVQSTDVVLESFPVGTLAALGLDYHALCALNPRLIMASITPFGQTGPYHDYQAPDLIGMAVGGFLHLTGDAAGTPLRVGFPQAYLHAAAEAAAGTMVAYYERLHSGLGQHIDVSMQTCVIGTLMNATPYPRLHGYDAGRAGLFNTSLGGTRRLVYACQDGYVSFVAIGGALGAHSMRALTAWMAAEQMAPAGLQQMDWDTWDVVATVQAGADGQQQIDAIEAAVAAFFLTHTKHELYEGCLARRVLLAPVSDMRDILQSPQLAARDYFVTLYHEDLGESLRYPGAFARLTATPLQIIRRAPRLGEHNWELYVDELGLTPADMIRLQQFGVISPTPAPVSPAPYRVTVAPRPTPQTPGPARQPFAGLRGVDFTWYGVGPVTTKYLADHGAEVIKIESMARPDLLRLAPPWHNATPDVNASQFFAQYNTNKLSLSLDLNRPEARELVRRLIATADVVAESFSPRAMPRWGLDYATLLTIKPDLVMYSTCQQGQTGPHNGFVGTGNLLAALSGFYQITGYEGAEPMPVYGAYTDFIVPRLAITALIAALAYRQRTGQGQHIDVSQYEAALHFLAPLLLDYEVNHRLAGRRGNGDDQAAPHGVYRCQGEDRWCAIAISTDAQWQALCEVLGHPDWTQAPEFASRLQRLRHTRLLDQHIETWTQTQAVPELMHRLQAVGIPAGMVYRCSDLYDDPQLQHRGFFVELEHPLMGPTLYDGPQAHLSRTPALFHRPAPLLGQHNDYVLRDLLGLSEAEVVRLSQAQVLS